MSRSLPHVDGVTHTDVQVGSLRLHVALAGSDDAPPLLLLHGWPQHWYLWRNIIPHVAPRFRVIAPDMRGFGWSDAPAGGYRKEQLATDILGLLDALDVPRVRLVAHDWGAWVGFLLALRAPERIERYLPLNMITPFMPPSFGLGAIEVASRGWYTALLAGPLGPPFLASGRLAKGVRDALIDPTAMDDGDALQSFMAVFGDPAHRRATQLLYREFLLREVGPAMAGRYRGMRLTVPTRMLFGTEDRAIARSAVADTERFGEDYAIEYVEGVGHFIVDEQPDLVNARIDSFLG